MPNPGNGYYLEPGYSPDTPDPTGRWREPGGRDIVQSQLSAATGLLIFGAPKAAVINAAYSFTPIVLGGVSPRSFSLTGTLPAGLSFSSSTGAISGTATAAGTTTGLVITVTDAKGSTSALNVPPLIVASTAEAASYFNRITTKPAAGVVAALDTLIVTLTGSTVWAKLDCLYVLAQDTLQAAFLNLAGFYPLAMTGSPTFTPRQGVTGTANSSLTNNVLLSDGTFANYSLNSAHAGVFIATAGSATTPILGTAAGGTLQIQPKSASGNFGAFIGNTTTLASANAATRVGHYVVSRLTSTSAASYRNGGAALVTNSTATTALTASAAYLFRDAGNFALDQVSAFHMGSGLTQAENQTLYNALNTAVTAIAGLGAAPAPSATDFDLVVYGGTLSGLMAAQRAANRGARVAIVEPTAELGGVGHHGLTYFDLAQKGLFGSLHNTSNAFFVALAKYYTPAKTTAAQTAEPKVYDQYFQSTLAATGAATFLSSPLVTSADVRKSGDAIMAVKTASGWITGRSFVDASYEMDLAALAGAPYQVGREGVAAYGEPDAGFSATRIADGGFNFGTDNVGTNTGYPVKPKPARANGAADNLIQPISYRFPITTASNRLPFPAPPGGYVSSKMDQFVAVLLAKNVQSFASAVYIGGDTAIPNNKFVINNSQSNIFPSIELSGYQMGYPDGTPAQRQQILADIRSWTLHVLYCLQNDTRLPSALRTDAANYGLCADEFTSAAIPGFPNMPYIREGRRLKGKYVFTQFDALQQANPLNTTSGARTNYKTNRVAQWNYIQDSHAMELYADNSGGTANIVITGNAQHADVDPYDIPYTVLHTDPAVSGHVSNLLVPLCYSSSSVGWMSGRLEPNFAQLGEVAGEAVMIAAEDGIDISAVPWSRLSRRVGSPVSTSQAIITGTPQIGQTLTCPPVTWTNGGNTTGYQWRRGSAAISGATSGSYTTVAGDAGLITCVQFGANVQSQAVAVAGVVVTN